MRATNGSAPPPRSLFERVLLRSFEYHHRRLLWGVRLVWGVLLVGLAVLTLVSGRWWPLLSLLFLGSGGSGLLSRLPHLPEDPKPAAVMTPERV
jgi:hypothetical protein